MTKTYKLTFEGYWSASPTNELPTYSGIYSVYVCSVFQTTSFPHIIIPDKLIYIGMADNISMRVSPSAHHKWDDWQSQIKHDQQLYFTTAPLEHESDRKRAEAAMIFHHGPECNDIGTDRFHHDTTTVETSGDNSKMTERFTVDRV